MIPVVEEGLRFILAGPSIVSDWGNPAATTNRAVMTALIDLGYEATYLEPRRDPALLDLLRARGSAPLRAFLAAYPRLQYRTVDLPEAFQSGSWAGQFLATASASVALLGCPPVIEDGFRQFEEVGVRFLTEREAGAGSELTDATGDRIVTSYQPAVLPREWDEPRSGTLLVAYDDAELAQRVAEIVQPDAMVVSGRAELPGWEWAPEVDLPERYGRAARVVVVDSREHIAPARVWLARANGATAWGVVGDRTGTNQAEIAIGIEALSAVDWAVETPLVEAVDARLVAQRLAAVVVRRGVMSPNGKG